MIRAKPNNKMKKLSARKKFQNLFQRVFAEKRKGLRAATQKIEFLQNLESKEAFEDLVEFLGYLKNSQRKVAFLNASAEEELKWFTRTIPFTNLNRSLLRNGKTPLTKEELNALFSTGMEQMKR